MFQKAIIYFLISLVICSIAACGDSRDPDQIIVQPPAVNNPPPVILPAPSPRVYTVNCYNWRSGRLIYGPVSAYSLSSSGRWSYIRLYPGNNNVSVRGRCVAF